MPTHDVDGRQVEFEHEPTSEDIEDARQHLASGLEPSQRETTSTTERQGPGWVSRTLSRITPTPRQGLGMVGAGLGGTLGAASPIPGGTALGGALGYETGAKAYDVVQNVAEGLAGEPISGPRTLGEAGSQAVEDLQVGVGGEVGGHVLGKVYQRIAQTRAARFVLSKIFRMDEIEAGKAAQTASGKAWADGKATNGRLFDVIEKTAGDDGPHLTETGQVLQEVVETERKTPGGIPKPTGRMMEATIPEFEGYRIKSRGGKERIGFERGAHIIRVLRKAAPDLDLDTVVAIAQGLHQKGMPTKVIEDVATHAPDVISVLMSEGKVPFYVARRAETELSGMAGNQLVPSPRQMIYRRLAGAMGRDIDQWLEMEGSGESATALREAKAKWRDFRANNGLLQQRIVGNVKLTRGGEPVAPERALLPEEASRVPFDPKTPSITRAAQRILPYETYRDLVQTWLRGLYEESIEEMRPGDPRFSQRAFARKVAEYIPKGHLELILEPLVSHGDLPGGSEALLRAVRPGGVTRAGEKMMFGEHAPGIGALSGFMAGGAEPALTHLPSLMGGMSSPVNPLELTLPALGAGAAAMATRPGGQLLQALGQTHPIERFAGPLLSEEAIRRAFGEALVQQGQRR